MTEESQKNIQNRDSSLRTSCFTQNDNVGLDSSVIALQQNDKVIFTTIFCDAESR